MFEVQQSDRQHQQPRRDTGDLDFIGAPDVQMQTAARLWGHCCICSKELSDPHSLERGIGPDCFRRRVDYITNLAVDGRRLEEITYLSGMPAAFVTELLRESVAQGGSR